MKITGTGYSVYRILSVLFAISWFFVVLFNILAGAFQRILISMDMAGIIFLTYDTHTDITKGIDPEPDNNNFYKNDEWIKIIFLPIVAVHLVALSIFVASLYPDELRSGFVEFIVSLSGESYNALIYFLFLFISGWLLGGYIYIREPDVGGALHRSMINLLRIFGDDAKHDLNRLETALGRESGYTRLGRIFLAQATVGLVLSFIAIIIAFLGYLVLSSPRVTLAAIFLWFLYSLIRERSEHVDLRVILKRLDESTEGPQRLLFDFEIVELGLKGVLAVFFVAVGFGFPIVWLSLLSDFVFELLPQLITYRMLTHPGVAVINFSSLSVIVSGVLLMAYSFVTWYALLNRLSGWLKSEPAETKFPKLPWGVTSLYPAACFVYFGLMIGLLSYINTDDLNFGNPSPRRRFAAAAMVIFTLLYMVLLYEAYISANREIQSSILRLERDDYRIPFLFLVNFTSPELLSISLGISSIAPRLLLFGFGLGTVSIYFYPDVKDSLAHVTSNQFVRSLLSDTYLFLIILALVIGIVTSGVLSDSNLSEWMTLSELAILTGLLGGLLYSSTIIEHILFR